MEYQNIDEATRREACERVKQIVKAIKAIKIKYYLNFARITQEDQDTYDKLEADLEKISTSHNLNDLRVALMQEVEAKYNGNNMNDMGTGMQNNPDDILQACYGAIDAEKDALSRGGITQALRCQTQLNQYKQQLDPTSYNEVKNYKREKFAELMQTREQVEEQVKSWNTTMRGCYKIKDVTKRNRAMELIQSLQNRDKQPQKDTEEQTIII